MYKYSARVAIISILASGMVLSSDVEPASIGLISHQPRNFPQMQALVTPADPAVTRALDPVLGINGLNDQTDPAARFDTMRNWVLAGVTYAFDVDAHGVKDYWQSPSQTLSLRAGDCEDFALLLVSLLRASGVPDDQVYVAVGYDPNGECHALLVERYCTGLWRFVTADTADEPSFVDAPIGRSYDISYCFNDRAAFTGLPAYAPDYTPPPMPTPPDKSRYDHVRLQGIRPSGWFEGDINLQNPGHDAIKNRMGKLWLPAYLPQGYVEASASVGGNWSAWLTYYREGSYAFLMVHELADSVDLRFPENTIEEVPIHDKTAYLVRGGWNGNPANWWESWDPDAQVCLFFEQDGLVFTIYGIKSGDWISEELIKMAESMTPY
jgi:hypothetical protein